MTDESNFTTGEASVQEQHGYQPLPDNRPKEDETGTYGSDQDGLKYAAMDLENSRAENNQGSEFERDYFQPDGSRTPDRATIKIDRAADDLSNLRQQETAAEDAEAAKALAEQVDAARMQAQAEALGIENPLEAARQALKATEQRAAELAGADDGIPSAEDPLPVPADKEIAEVLEKHPVVRAALEQEVAEIAKYKAEYVQATDQAARLAASAFMQQFPELQGLTPEQLPHMVAVIGQRNPARHAQIIQAAQGVQAIYNNSQAAAAQEQKTNAQRQAQQFERFATEQDAAFDDAIKSEPAETVRAVKSQVFEIAQSAYGISAKELTHLWNTQPVMRTAAMQKMMYDAAKYQLAQRTAMANPASRSAIPPVQRPGVSRPAPRFDDSHVRGLEEKFNRNPSDVRTAAKLLAAQRAAGG